MDLNKIGFYTLTNDRVKNLDWNSPIARAEIILTDRCNLKCPYCRGLLPILQGDMSKKEALHFLKILITNGVKNIRFSGGEPTLCPFLDELVWTCKLGKLEHIAISTNGTADRFLYKYLMTLGVNDFSISLDAGCCSIGKVMTGGNGEAWDKAVDTIKYLSKYVYVTVGTVFNELNYQSAQETVEFIDSLSPGDIRIISSAQYNQALSFVARIPTSIASKYPILSYRINNFLSMRSMRGIKEDDSKRCYIVLDDLAIANRYHFPCIIYMREQGSPIGEMNESFRDDRIQWFKKHNTHEDRICKENCLDVCIDHNNECAIHFTKSNREETFQWT